MCKCPATNQECKFFGYQKDVHEDIVLTFCSHPDNKNEYEGNTTSELCPLLKGKDNGVL